jgi:beta-lactamase superfamily II metal-dependent hydrolase
VYREIFDVEHGACALITTSNGKRVMINCGHNATTGWKPGNALRRHNITYLDGLCVTNYDEDHVSGYPNLAESVFIGTLFRNPSVPPSAIRQLKSENGMGVGIERLIWSIHRWATREPGLWGHELLTVLEQLRGRPGVLR